MSNVLEQALEAFKDLFGAGMVDCMMGDGKDDQIAAIAKARIAIAALKEAIKNQSKSALAEFTDCAGSDETDPIERLRFFCSLAMKGQDWLDVEPFFEAIKQRGEPVATLRVTMETHDMGQSLAPNPPFKCAIAYASKVAIDMPLGKHKLYTSAPTIPEGWQLVPIEPTPEMVEAANDEPQWRVSAWEVTTRRWKAMLSAAPKGDTNGS